MGRLESVAARIALQIEDPNDIVDAASEALERGADSASLRRLAGMSPDSRTDLVDEFRRVAAEVGVWSPSRREALLYLARETAADIVRGRVSPIDGANAIWNLTLAVSGEAVPSLDPFIYAASEWQERPDDRRTFEAMVVRASNDLIAEG